MNTQIKFKIFYSNLNLESISDKDCEHAKTVWNTFNIKNLGEYTDLYVKNDTSLLADVFETFRKTCLKIYELDPTHYVSLTGFAWDSMLKLTKVEIEPFTDIDMHLMFEERIRGGISQSIHKYAKANNKYMKSYNEKAISSYLQYLDANKLCGWAMSKKLPISNFKWDDINKYTSGYIKTYDKNSNIGALLKVDLEYPKKLHHLHSDLPFLCESKIMNKMNKIKSMNKVNKMKSMNKVNKLVTTLEDKDNYVVNI